MEKGIGILLVLALSVLQEGNALTCSVCDSIAFPRDCQTVVTCREHEECFTDKIVTYDNKTYFNTGCRDKQECLTSGKGSLMTTRRSSFQTKVCSQCCDTNLCNVDGCGAPSLPSADKRGPICYACDMMRDPQLCNRVTLCSREELCEILKTPHPTFDVTYTAKCGTKTVCDRLMSISHGLGRRESKLNRGVHKRATLCFRCCTGDLCNLGCGEQNVTATIFPGATSTTVLKTQTTLPTSKMTSTTTGMSATTHNKV